MTTRNAEHKLHYGGEKCALCRTLQTDWGEPIIEFMYIGLKFPLYI